MPELNTLWQSVLGELEASIPRASFITWFKDTNISDMKEGCVTVSVPNGFAKEWIQNKYHKQVLRFLRILSHEIKDVAYVIGAPTTSGAYLQAKAQKKRPLFVPKESDQLDFKELNVNPDTNLNPRYTFDTFIVGSFNELAHAAARSVVKNLGRDFNPLFIHGKVGVGKTHLIQAVGNAVVKESPHAKVKYISSEKFMGEILEALRRQDMNSLKDKYRNIDLLIMDDIQFIARTEKMQEEFFHTFNALYEKNKQIIISSDRPPAAIATLEDRLRSRFEGGMMADIGEPDYETRLTILRLKCDEKKIAMAQDILEYIAAQIKNNIRELEGALNRVILTSQMSPVPPTIDDVKNIIQQIIYSPKKFTSPKKVIKAVADFYELSERELINRSRKKEVVRPRQMAMYLLREELKCSFPFIGEKMGKKDHTTAIHAYKKISGDLKRDADLESEMRVIKERMYIA
ncbi:MAG: hypothetical protein A3I44_00885 [Candidatus Sungbacteria bacterium RIFCSPLOWO2_02_FULL_51_17]|uniref:Chromosomal replication initiator protein DnaA n=1 Tax=Candidatus Sungbacteria bacterium RIFCSPHIGHO2_02_FULL_51_29 TaxID=1802273 RepID=A0A1G2KXL0_9BACT|nr:MAG: hypothetical protein A2676_05770 [Candidatus Sungbacteria bacterium RIFCSPHIGHO2_01_FULL_51_22]OHA03181.1 MAG: hypothetical protein A3C16_01830 [Candidatus Sungbacteria bacterium RIFCSPHIGHO2_02_FULL_51_29]OHA07882.1 MAG: hypothetical protein A3B29_01350 [Candidatus Sungbacteria bacterium RIFCSPLOWO2_01_FULL_51_34]OHA10676.1 MAG: hypothetical protein A3I44_00885 [Candidatus Sungbacteria bacterium RIFCSPLOWO2_02_FULL_51_17]